ncbi:NAD(P)-binding protein [Calocera viscosa TUFC12733]|uniref:NAD(P)-binding protein n=1 Tax=Calocera viscosa (strain TUFC12733) TaxID=1330018 RepID=A0A167R4L4_CALVF|nr:NAD(P)-binding protein [Calocera viscosa TUFC12733]
MSADRLPMFRSLSQLVNKTVVVIGGSSGIGYEVAKGALEHGAKVIIASSHADKVEAAVTRLSELHEIFRSRISGSTCNAKSETDIERFWDGVGKFDHLVWTAGELINSGFVETKIGDQKESFDVHFWGPVISAKYIAKKGYINTKGSITLTIGSSFRKPLDEMVIVAAIGGAIDGLTRGLAVQLAPIRVNAVSPGYVETEIWNAMDPKRKTGLSKFVATTALVRHVAQPEELADAYLFCMKCTNITGITLDVDGGRLLAQPIPN